MRLLNIAFALTILSALPAAAQNAVGQWNCEWGFQNTAPGVPADAIGGAFAMALYANGGAEGQGTEMGSSGQFPFVFQGAWQSNGRAIQVQGGKQGGLSFGGAQFSFQSNFTGPGQMAMTQRYANGQVYASRCIKLN